MNLPITQVELLSAYSSVDAIPGNRILSNYEEEFSGTDTWAEYMNDHYNEENWSESRNKTVDRAIKRWKGFCENKGVHHALASPKLVNEWCSHLLQDMKKTSAKRNYYSYIDTFYRYLVWHINYPHVYNPFQYAILEYELANEVWSSVER